MVDALEIIIFMPLLFHKLSDVTSILSLVFAGAVIVLLTESMSAPSTHSCLV